MKKIGLLLIALCLFTLVGCFGLNEITSLEFDNSPAGSYEKGVVVDAKDFSVKATFSDGTTETLSLTNSNLTVQGLVDDQLDTREPGIHTLKVTYKGFSITFNYIVTTSDSTVTTNWAQAADVAEAVTDYVVDGTTVTIKTNFGLAWFAKQVSDGTTINNVLLAADIDMQAYEWAPINKFAGTFDGRGHSISNIRITKESHQYVLPNSGTPLITGKNIRSAAGLFGWVNNGITVKNLTLVNTSIDVIQNEKNELVTKTTCEYYKNYGAVVGLVTAGTASLENVNVVNFYLRGVGRLGGLIGYSIKDTIVNIKNCYVDGSFVSYNPVTSSEFADGEGDKVGGFIGQTANQVDILNSSAKVNIMGTRDLGGMIGYNGGKTTITNCQLLTGSVISASVAGGMELAKGSRNIGGVVGTSAPNTEDKKLVLDNVTVAEDTVIVSNSLYGYSSAGKYVGGFRGEGQAYTSGVIVITFIKGGETINVDAELPSMSSSTALGLIENYLISQAAALAELNSK